MKLHQSSDPILQFLADYTNDTLVRSFLSGFGDRRNAELRRLKVRMEGLETENRALRLGHLPLLDKSAPVDEIALEDGAILTGQIVGIDHLHIVIRLDDGAEHLIPIAEFIENDLLEIELGDHVNLVVSVIAGGIALSHLAYKEMLLWLELALAFDTDNSVEVLLQMPVKGGYSASYRGLAVFIPSSQSDLAPGRHVEQLLGSMIEVKLLEVDGSAKRLVASRKQVMEERRDSLLASLKPGDVVEGVVKNVTDFGAFIDLGAATALLHASQMGPLAGTVMVGTQIQARVVKVDAEQKKISLSAKPAVLDAWEQLPQHVAVGSTIAGKIKKLTAAGAFIEILPGISGLVFQSNLNSAYPDAAIPPRIGDTVSVTVRDIDVERRRIGLRMRRTPSKS